MYLIGFNTDFFTHSLFLMKASMYNIYMYFMYKIKLYIKTFPDFTIKLYMHFELQLHSPTYSSILKNSLSQKLMQFYEENFIKSAKNWNIPKSKTVSLHLTGSRS